MQLTDKQKEMVAAFLRNQDEAMDHLPADKRVEFLTQIKQRVREELLKVGKEELSNGRVQSVLDRFHVSVPKTSSNQEAPNSEPEEKEVEAAPETPKPSPPPTEETPSPPAADFPDNGRHWMGVCVVLSDHFGQPVNTIRWGFVILACLTGPLAFLLYLGALAYTRKKFAAEYPRIELTTILAKVIRVLCIAVGLYAISFVILYAIAFLYLIIVGEHPLLGDWDRVSEGFASTLTYLLFLLSSMAALSAMPLAHKWDKTLSTLTNTGLAIYAVILSVGVALTITGYLLSAMSILFGS